MPSKNNRILMATDLSVFSSEIFRYTIELAVKMQAEIVIVHAVEPLGVLADAMLETYVPRAYLDKVREKGMPVIIDAIRQEVMESVAHECEFHNAPVHIVDDLHVGVGEACEVVLNAARQFHANLVVCGSGSPENAQTTALGSTASKILQLSHLPVVMVPASQTKPQIQSIAS